MTILWRKPSPAFVFSLSKLSPYKRTWRCVTNVHAESAKGAASSASSAGQSAVYRASAFGRNLGRVKRSENIGASGAWKNANAIVSCKVANLARHCFNPIHAYSCAPVADVIWLTPIGLPFQLDVSTAVDCIVRKKLRPVRLISNKNQMPRSLAILSAKQTVQGRTTDLSRQNDQWP